MLHKNQTTRPSSYGLMLFDAAIVMFSFYACSFLRDPLLDLLKIKIPAKEVFSEIYWVTIIACPLLPFILSKYGFYSGSISKRLSKSISQTLHSVFALGGVIALLSISLKLPTSSRLTLGLSFIFIVILIIIRDQAWRNYSKKKYSQDDQKEPIVIAGSELDIQEIKKLVKDGSLERWHVVGEFNLEEKSTDELKKIIDSKSVVRVLFSIRHTKLEQASAAIELCEMQGVEAWVSAGFIRTQLARPDFDIMAGKPMLVLRTTPALSWTIFAKAFTDRVGACILLIFSLPLWVVAYVGVRLTSPEAPVLFKQQRSGRFGKPFMMYKIRTMSPDAEHKLNDIKEQEGNDMSGPVFKLDNDPRVFKFGNFLRKTSIDELPQLINVIKGDMSLVGPRPLPVYEVKEFDESRHRRRLSVKPGITCTWQAGGRNTISSFEEWVDMDLEYIDTWSFWKDVLILLKTIPAVFFSKGAK